MTNIFEEANIVKPSVNIIAELIHSFINKNYIFQQMNMSVYK